MYIVINGGGKVGSYLADTLASNGHDVTVIEVVEAAADRLVRELPSRVQVILGDGCDSSVILEAGCERADIFVATIGRDDDNLVSCELAKTICGVPRCIARVNNPRNERIFRRMGIESVSSTTVISRLIEEEALAGTMQAVSNLRNNDVCMIEMRVPGGGGTLAEHGLRVSDIELPKGSLVAAINRDGNLEVAMQDMKVFPGDTIILLSDMSMADQVRAFVRDL